MRSVGGLLRVAGLFWSYPFKKSEGFGSVLKGWSYLKWLLQTVVDGFTSKGFSRCSSCVHFRLVLGLEQVWNFNSLTWSLIIYLEEKKITNCYHMSNIEKRTSHQSVQLTLKSGG